MELIVEKLTIVVGGLLVLTQLSVYAAIGYAVVHFVTKYW